MIWFCKHAGTKHSGSKCKEGMLHRQDVPQELKGWLQESTTTWCFEQDERDRENTKEENRQQAWPRMPMHLRKADAGCLVGLAILPS
jgi:hypothetical protein